MIWIMTAVIALVLFYAFVIEPNMIQLRRKTIELNGYAMQTLQVLHLSDMHFFAGQETRKDFMLRLADEVQPDLIFITGDLVDDDSGIGLCLEALKPFRAKYGIYGVLGNHDHFYVRFRDVFHFGESYLKQKRKPNDTQRLLAGLDDLGIRILHNERVRLAMEHGELTIAGLDDPYLRRDDIPKTFAGYQKNGPCLALSHTPDPYKELIGAGADIIFCGHTHGGQIRLPFWGPIVTRTTAPRRMVSGLHRVEDAFIHITTGLGSGKFTYLRFLCHPEVTIFTISFISKE